METFDHIQHMGKMLRNLDAWLGKGAEHATSRSFDPNVLLQARLAPDQFALVRQIQAGADAAKFAAAALAGQVAPSHPDTETTYAEIRQRIATVLGYLETFKASDFVGAAERKISPAWARGKWFQGDHYLLHVAIPNFMFHVTTASAILRHNGVPVGKTDFLGQLVMHDA